MAKGKAMGTGAQDDKRTYADILDNVAENLLSGVNRRRKEEDIVGTNYILATTLENFLKFLSIVIEDNASFMVGLDYNNSEIMVSFVKTLTMLIEGSDGRLSEQERGRLENELSNLQIAAHEFYSRIQM